MIYNTSNIERMGYISNPISLFHQKNRFYKTHPPVFGIGVIEGNFKSRKDILNF